MKFSCNRNDIISEVTTAQEIISTRNTLSILSNVLLETGDNTLFLRATDLKVSFQTEIPVDVIEPGTTTVYCDKFLGILRSLPEGEIEFDQHDQQLDIRPKFKKIDFQLKSIASDNYPEIQDVGDNQYFELSQAAFLEMINQTVFAVSDDETRHFMNGVFMERVDGKLVMVATDGRRLSYIEKEVSSPLPAFTGVIIPPKILTMIRKLAGGEGSISLAVTDRHLFARMGTKRLSSNLIEGNFPQYARVIPESQDYEIVVDRDELSEALSRVSILAEQRSLRVFLSVNENALLLHSEESEIGIAREEIACRYSGPEISLALNFHYLVDPLRVMEGKAVIIRFTDSKKAISVVSDDEKEYVHVFAPMNLD